MEPEHHPDLIRNVLAQLRPAAAIAVPPGMLAFTRRDVMSAGLDTLAVARWLHARGGYGAVAYLRPRSHKLAGGNCRPALHPVSYFAVPIAALEPPAARRFSGTSGNDVAAALRAESAAS